MSGTTGCWKKVAQRVDDADVMHLLKVMLKASGKKGVPQGGVISPLLSNLYLNEVDRMLERAREVTRNGKYTYIEYARFADDLVILIDAYKRHDWLIGAVERRLREELNVLKQACLLALTYCHLTDTVSYVQKTWCLEACDDLVGDR